MNRRWICVVGLLVGPLGLAGCGDRADTAPDAAPTVDATIACGPGDGLESCEVFDDGWNVRCEAGQVLVDDLTATGFCEPGSVDVVCVTGGAGIETVHSTCATGCLDAETRWIETVEEFDAFDFSSLCAPA